MSINFGLILVYIKVKKFIIALPFSTYFLNDLIHGLIDLFDLIGWKKLKSEDITKNGLLTLCTILQLSRNTGRYDLVDIEVGSKKEGKVRIKIKVI
ncbi:MAG: hypothetical protein KAG94_01115 [Clostridiales bacterium]|nr:hypothetical protein [Clostridiales bacterium]